MSNALHIFGGAPSSSEKPLLAIAARLERSIPCGTNDFLGNSGVISKNEDGASHY